MMLRDTRRKAPTLIVFAREPAAGAAKTRLIPRLGAAGAARLADAFIADAMAKAARIANCRTVIAAAAPGGVRASPYFTAIARRFDAGLVDQGDGDLGRRMARVLSAYADPPGAVLIGTDTPTLPPAFIRESIAGLRQAQVVIAPALDGGYYLIGACGPLPAIFDRIPWGGASVFAHTLRRLRSLKVRYRIGRWWYDVDRPADLDFMACDLARSPARRQACPATVRTMRAMGLLAVNGRTRR